MYIYFRLVAVTQLIMEKKLEKQYLVRAFERLGMTTLTAMQGKNLSLTTSGLRVKTPVLMILRFACKKTVDSNYTFTSLF